jgi:Amt family ammonium transporter
MTSFIYSVVVFWVWGGGWLKIGGYHDYAGSSCVHLVGGTCAFWGAYMLGERYGKKRDREIKEGRRDPNMRKSLGFEHKEIVQVLESVHEDYHEAFKEYLVNQTDEFRPYNPAFMILGTLLLWVCWLFFNAGSIPTISIRRCNNAPKICMINIISPAVSGLFCVFIKPHITNEYSAVNKFDIGTFCNGIIVGLVAVTANCDNVEPWAAAVIGVVAATMYSYGCKFIHKIHVDDPVEAAPLHFSGGSWGTIAVGLFDVDRGLFYAKSGGWGFLGW